MSIIKQQAAGSDKCKGRVQYLFEVRKQNSSHVAVMSTHASFWFPTVLKYSNLHF